MKPNVITLEAQTPQGIFYGMQTLRQLLPHQIERPYQSNVAWAVPCVEIEDYPRFVHRGLMLDVCRHFQPKEFVMKFIDMLAYHKMNTFRWHLTDDQGWRIEIKKYPKLQQVSAFRNRTLKGRYTSPEKRQWNNMRYGGYYTQEDIREVIAYAQKRFVTIIPEIEMQGHAVAALTALIPNFPVRAARLKSKGFEAFSTIFIARKKKRLLFCRTFCRKQWICSLPDTFISATKRRKNAGNVASTARPC